MKKRLLVHEGSILRVPRHVRLGYDQARACWVVLAPERMFVPDQVSVDVLKRLDGRNRMEAIIDDLAKEYAAERATIAADVLTMLQDLADKGLVITLA